MLRITRKFALVAVAATLALQGGAVLAGETTFGKGVQGPATVKVSELMANPDPYVGKTVRVEGLVVEVCSKRGCWMELASDKEFQTIKIKVDDGVIVFPMEAKGKTAVAEGVFTKIDVTAEQLLAMKKHEAEEKGTPFDPKSVTGGKSVYQIKGSGAVVR